MRLLLAAAPIELTNPLGTAAWAVLGLVPLGILILYFLKLRRRPVQVPSTLLWMRSLEDLHVNSLFQRLRRNLLLFLQLLVVGLTMFALLGPQSQGLQRQGRRLVLAIDESASMAATDVAPSRLAKAKAEARKILDAMGSGDLAMIVAFSDQARVVANYTENTDLLRRRLDAIQPTEAPTSLREALQLVAGLANPQKQVGEGQVATDVVPPRLFLFTDGGFPDVEGFSLGTIQPEVVAIGPPLPPVPPPAAPGQGPVAYQPPSDNVAILALECSRDRRQPDRLNIFGRAHNFRDEPVATRAQLVQHDPERPSDPGTVIDAIELELAAQADQGFEFALENSGTDVGALEVRLDVEDALAIDNRAFAAFGKPRQARVLLVGSGNRFLNDALGTDDVRLMASITEVTAEQAQTGEIARDLDAGAYDLVIYDRVRPETLPEANTLFLGTLPPGLDESSARSVEYPVVLDWDVSHPLLQYVRDLNRMVVARARIVELPRGARELIQSSEGAIGLVIPRGAYLDTVLTFPLIEGGKPTTNWPLLTSFPLFILNSLQVLGHGGEAQGATSYTPGQPVPIRPDLAVETVEVTDPAGRSSSLARSAQGSFLYGKTGQTGLYRAGWTGGAGTSFAVNLFDPRESDLAPRGQIPPGVSDDQLDRYRIKIGFTPVEQATLDAPSKRAWWWPLALLALAVVLLEWFIYNRRVYI